MDQLGFDLFNEEAGNAPPPPNPAPAGWYFIDGWIKRNPAVRDDLGGIPTIMFIENDGMVYTAAKFQVRNQWPVYDRGFGITSFRKEGTITLETAYGLSMIGALKVVS